MLVSPPDVFSRRAFVVRGSSTPKLALMTRTDVPIVVVVAIVVDWVVVVVDVVVDVVDFVVVDVVVVVVVTTFISLTERYLSLDWK